MKKITLQQYAELINISYQALRKRMFDNGKKPSDLHGVVRTERIGRSWLLTIDPKKFKKTSEIIWK